jgi:outer membrane immunogenic protein
MGRIFPLGAALLGALLTTTSLSAADLKVPPVYKAPPPQVQMWGGAYVGVNAGYGWGDWDTTGTWSGYAVDTAPSVKGAFGGVQGGYNWQFNQFVLGIETDFQLSGISGTSDLVSIPGKPQVCTTITYRCGGTSTDCTPAVPGKTVSADWDMNWFSTVRGRAGIDINGWLAYGTAGLAIADIDFSGATSGSKTKAGYVVGAGLETFVARNWTVKAEYLYMDLGSTTFTGSGTNSITTDVQEHLVRVGANYHFGR